MGIYDAIKISTNIVLFLKLRHFLFIGFLIFKKQSEKKLAYQNQIILK
jgi:hypothetical protein